MAWAVLGVVVVVTLSSVCNGSSEVSSFSWKKDGTITDYISTSGYRSSQYVRSRYHCGWDCYVDDSCMSFFYNSNSDLCVTEGTIRLSSAGLSSMPGTSYYALTADQLAEKMCAPQYTEDFQLVSLGDGAFIRIWAVHEFKTWDDARTFCDSNDGALFRPTSASRQGVIQDLLQCQGMALHYWIDGQKDNQYAPWTTWDHTHTYTQTYWNSPNPDKPDEEWCLEYQPNGGWNDKVCAFTERFICEKPA